MTVNDAILYAGIVGAFALNVGLIMMGLALFADMVRSNRKPSHPVVRQLAESADRGAGDKPVPYGSKCDETKRPVTQADIADLRADVAQALLASDQRRIDELERRVKALEKPAAPGDQLPSPRAFVDEDGWRFVVFSLDKVLGLMPGSKRWRPWTGGLAVTVRGRHELHGEEAAVQIRLAQNGEAS